MTDCRDTLPGHRALVLGPIPTFFLPFTGQTALAPHPSWHRGLGNKPDARGAPPRLQPNPPSPAEAGRLTSQAAEPASMRPTFTPLEVGPTYRRAG